jgi:hypothetical protein
MAEKQALNATFFAFRKREQSGVLTGLSIAFAILALVLAGSFVALFWSSIGPFISWYAQVISAAATNDTAAIESIGFPETLPMFILGVFLWLFPIYILFAAYEAGALRWMVHGERAGFMGLSLGAPTWRVWSVYWIWFLLNIAFSIVMSIVMGVVIGVLAVSSGGDPGAAMAALPAVYVLQYGLMIYFGVRFAPAAATTIARRKFAFFDAWTVTKGRFLPMLGSFILLYLIYLVVALVLAGVGFAYIVSVAQIDLTSISADPANVEHALQAIMPAVMGALAQPQSWVVLGAMQLVSVILGMVFYMAFFGINARAALVALEEGKIKPAA